ncbi:LPXTG cell wall anchor domain-containing protein [Kitasatospora sp. NPDC001159]
MRTSAITRFAKNDRTFSGRRLAALAATVVLAGGVQILATDTAWACSGPYQANNPTISKEAQARHHNGTPVSGFIDPDTAASLQVGGSAEIGVEFANFTGADYEDAAPSLTLRDGSGANLHLKDVTVEAMHNGAWVKLGTDDGCGGEAVRVDTSSLLQPLKDGRASRMMFRVSLAAGAPKDLTSLSITTSAWAEVSGTGKSATRSVKVVHPKTAEAKPTSAAKPAPAKPAKPAADKTEAAPAADKTEAAPATPATTAPEGTPELAHTGASENNTFLAVSAAALLALGAGVLIAVRRLRPQG